MQSTDVSTLAREILFAEFDFGKTTILGAVIRSQKNMEVSISPFVMLFSNNDSTLENETSCTLGFFNKKFRFDLAIYPSRVGL